ncbi:hypothetical protein DXA66_11370 [Faecalibacterium sp. OF03-6AC]|nr:hypothetical protein DXA66_11370 [Faecalibacterium sp. OF03-6AC]
MRHPADASCFEQHSHPASRCPNSNFLFPPLAAVVAVAGHSIARPIAFGNRVPPQRTVLRETSRRPAGTDAAVHYDPFGENVFGAARRPRQTRNKNKIPLIMARAKRRPF